MSHVSSKRELDKVAEIFIKLQRGQQNTVTPEDASLALEQHNKRMAKIQRLEQNQTDNKPVSEESGSKGMDKIRNENKKLKEEIGKLNNQIQELQLRLSKVAGDKLTDNNPDIADLSDPFRPTKLAEKFRRVYDDEWSNAHEEMDKLFQNERDLVNAITEILKKIEEFCKSVEETQLKKTLVYLKDDLVSPKYEKSGGTQVAGKRSEMNGSQEKLLTKMTRDVRKALGILCVTPLTEIFDTSMLKPLISEWQKNGRYEMSGLNEFVAKCLEIIWLMKIQNPPMEFLWANEGQPIDKNRFTFYTKTGEIVKHNVWPAVLLHKDGPLVSKGIVQGQ